MNLQDYIEFVYEHSHNLEVYCNLDDISSPEKTWENQKEMERQGLSPIPVYHLNEPLKFLQMAMDYPYFAVGGIATAAGKKLEQHLDVVFSRVCTEKSDFYPTHKIHGFGIAVPQLFALYPWYSVDSTSWVAYGKFGIILTPRQVNGKLRYDVPPRTVTISTRSKAVGEKDHFFNLPPMEQRRLEEYFNKNGLVVGESEIRTERFGYRLKEDEVWVDKKTWEVERIIERGLSNDGTYRDRLNLIYFLDLEQFQPEWPWKWHPKKRDSLFS